MGCCQAQPPKDADEPLLQHQAETKFIESATTKNYKSMTNNNGDAESKDSETTYFDTGDCDGNISLCPSLNRLIDVLIFYKSEKQNAQQIQIYFNQNKKKIINDYHHLLHQHLNEDIISKMESDAQFKHIYDALLTDNNLKCDINECMIYQRNNRDREDIKKKNVEMDLLDAIHCYFFHSIDNGYRIFSNTHEEKKDNDEQEEDNVYFDKEIKALRSRLSIKQNKMIQFRGTNRMRNNKFITQVINKGGTKTWKMMKKNKDRPKNDQTNNSYSFGLRFNYHKKNMEQYDFDALKPKYNDLKKELLTNKICKLGVEAFNDSYLKALVLINDSNHVKKIRCTNETRCDKYEVEYKSSLTINHVLSVIFYCDYDNLSYHFSSTFRLIDGDKNNKAVMKRNLEFGNWTKYLIQTVNCYGTMIARSKFNVLYHGISFLYLNKFISVFNGPTSTTTKLSVAVQFAEPHKGIVLELGKPKSLIGLNLRYFNCAAFSNFANEDERLFITPPKAWMNHLEIVGIRNIGANEKYNQHLIYLTTMQRIVGNEAEWTGGIDGIYSGTKTVDSEIISTINNLISDCLNGKDQANDEFPEYIKISFKNWINTMKYIHIDMEDINEYISSPSSLSIFNGKALPDLYIINKIFVNVEEIKYSHVGDIDFDHILFELTEINHKLKRSKLKWIVLENINEKCFVEYMNQFQEWTIDTEMSYDQHMKCLEITRF